MLDPSRDDRRYPYMPTVAEVLVGYCIVSDLKVQDVLKTYLGDSSKKFLEEEYARVLRGRQEKAKEGLLVAGGDASALGAFVTAALRDRSVEDVEKDGAYGIFQKPIYAVVDRSNQEIFKERLPEGLRDVLGKKGFSSYLLPY